MNYSLKFKKNAVARQEQGELAESICKDLKISHGALTNWRRKYGAEVRQELQKRFNPGEDPEPPKPQPKPVQKRARVPLGERSFLTFEGGDHETYVYRGVVEDDRRVGRVADFLAAGWEPVPKSEGRFGHEALDAPDLPGSTVSRASGLGATTYLLRKRKSEEDEDYQKTVLTPAAKLEEAIFGELRKDGRYGQVSLGPRTEERKP